MCFLAEIHLPDVPSHQAGLISKSVSTNGGLLLKAKRAQKNQIGSYFNLVRKGEGCLCGVIEYTDQNEKAVRVLAINKPNLHAMLLCLAASDPKGALSISLQYCTGPASQVLCPIKKASIEDFVTSLSSGKVGIPCLYLLRGNGP